MVVCALQAACAAADPVVDRDGRRDPAQEGRKRLMRGRGEGT